MGVPPLVVGERRSRRATTPGLRVRELALPFALLLGLAGAVWGSHVVNGSFYWADDWYHARLYLFSDGHGLLANQNAHTSRFEPVLGVLLALPYRLFGLRTELHLVLAIVLSAGAAVAFYWLLRTLGLARRHAGAMATLALLFPWADSSRLWAAASINNVAVICLFAGLVLSLRGLDATGRRATVLALGGTTLYVLGILTYVVVGGVVLATVLVYAWWSGPRRALRRWALDLAAVIPALVYVWNRQPPHHTDNPSIGEQLGHAGRITTGAVELLWAAVIPRAGCRGVAMALVVAAVSGAVLVKRALRPGDHARALLTRWLWIAGAAGVAIGLSYAPFVPGLEKYAPTAPGLLNRVNLLAAFGYAALVYALVVLVATLVVRAARREALVFVLCTAIAAGYTSRAVDDNADWARAARMANHELDTIARLVPDPGAGTVVYTFGEQNYAAPGVPVFALAGDLTHAVKVRLRSREVSAFPMRPPTRWVCDTFEMYPSDYAFGRSEGVIYGWGIFVSIPQELAVTINSEADCRRWSRQFGHPPRDEWP